MTAPLLSLSGVHTHIGAYHILQGVDLAVPPGQVTMLLGRNGAGKTTTLRTVMGLWAASQGTVAFDGVALSSPAGATANGGRQQRTTPEIARLGIAYVPENMGVFSDLSVSENMLLAAHGARTVGQFDPARLDWLLDLFPAL